MKNYKVSLTRVYHVDIEAKDEESAKEIVEYYLGDPKDVSNDAERNKEHFNIGEIEMVMNEATEIINENE